MNGQAVYNELRARILSCELAPGQPIFEQQLAQQFGISKSPIREALLRLQEQDLVEVKSRSGYRVASVSPTEAEQMYEMRRLYERACVKGVIARASDEQIAGVGRFLTTDAHMFAAEWITLNRRFHSELASISGNAHLARATMRLTDQFDRFTHISAGRLPRPIDFNRFNDEHAALVATLRIRNRKAALALVDAHIEGSRQRTLQALTEQGAHVAS